MATATRSTSSPKAVGGRKPLVLPVTVTASRDGQYAVYTLDEAAELLAPLSVVGAVESYGLQLLSPASTSASVPASGAYVPPSEVKRVLQIEMREPRELPKGTLRSVESYTLDMVAVALDLTLDSVKARIAAGKLKTIPAPFGMGREVVTRREFLRLASELGFDTSKTV